MKPVVNSFSGERIPEVFLETAPLGFERLDARRERRRKKLSYRLRRALGLVKERNIIR